MKIALLILAALALSAAGLPVTTGPSSEESPAEKAADPAAGHPSHKLSTLHSKESSSSETNESSSSESDESSSSESDESSSSEPDESSSSEESDESSSSEESDESSSSESDVSSSSEESDLKEHKLPKEITYLHIRKARSVEKESKSDESEEDNESAKIAEIAKPFGNRFNYSFRRRCFYGSLNLRQWAGPCRKSRGW